MVIYKIGTVVFFIILISLLSYKAIKDGSRATKQR